MQNNLEYKTFILISPSKYVITVTDVKDEIIFKKVFADTFMDQTREIDYIILNDFLKKNIFEIEKKLKKFIKTVHLIIDNENIYSIYFSIKNKVNIVTLDTKIVNDLLLDAKSCCKDTLKDTVILHMKIDYLFLQPILQNL